MVLAIVQVFVSNRLVSLDAKVAAISQESGLLEQQNSDLYQNIASRSAYLTIIHQAQNLGLDNDTQFLYLNQNYRVALERKN